MLEGVVDHVGDGFEAAMWVLVGVFGFVRGLVDLVYLIHVDEWVEVRVGYVGEGVVDGEFEVFV